MENMSRVRGQKECYFKKQINRMCTKVRMLEFPSKIHLKFCEKTILTFRICIYIIYKYNISSKKGTRN